MDAGVVSDCRPQAFASRTAAERSDPAALATPPTPFFSNLLGQIQRAYDLGVYLPPGESTDLEE
jgi:hypothetical protein